MSNMMSLSLSMPVLKRISTILAAGMLLAGCTTAELAIDLIKKNQKNKEEIEAQLSQVRAHIKDMMGGH